MWKHVQRVLDAILFCRFDTVLLLYFLIHAAVSGHLACFHVLAVGAASERGVQELFGAATLVSLDIIYPEAGLLGHMVILFLIFEQLPYCLL